MTTVTDHLAARGVSFDVLEHRPTTTSIEEALALGVDPSQVAKTIVLSTPAGYALAVIPASRRLDMQRVHEAIDRKAALASEDEIASRFPGVDVGGIPPIGSLFATRVHLDEELLGREWIVFADGRRDESVRVRTRDLLNLERAEVDLLTRREADEP